MTYEEKEFISFDNTKLYVREYGDRNKPLLLLIHGGGTDADFYVNTAPTLAQQFHVIAYDRRGHIRSWLTEKTQKVEEATKADKDALQDIALVHAKDAASLIRFFGNPVDMSTGAYVICHSIGGPVGYELVTKYPGLVRRILFVEPAWNIKEGLRRNKPTAYFPPIIFKDERGTPASEDVMANAAYDNQMATKFDKDLVLKYQVPVEDLRDKPILFAVGEQSKGRVIYEETKRIANELEKPLFFHPGVHNTGYNLPKEFAYLCAGALLDNDYKTN